MVDLQTEALIGIAVIGIALVSFGLYPIAKLALSQRKPRSARVSATREERDGLVTQEKKPKLKRGNSFGSNTTADTETSPPKEELRLSSTG